VRNYADYLGLEEAQTSALFKRDFDEKNFVKVLPDGLVRHEFSLKRFNVRQMVILGLAVFMLLIFILFQYRSVFIAPAIDINSPKEGSIVSQTVSISGKTDSNAIVTVDNEPVFVQSNGEFVKEITFFPGKTSFTIKAKNRLGKETTIIRNITVK